MRATTDHSFQDPWKDHHRMRSRVATAPDLPGFFVWIWSPQGVGWVYAGEDQDHVQEILNMRPSSFQLFPAAE